MAVLPFETADVLLSIKQAAHITERHIDTTQFLHKSPKVNSVEALI